MESLKILRSIKHITSSEEKYEIAIDILGRSRKQSESVNKQCLESYCSLEKNFRQKKLKVTLKENKINANKFIMLHYLWEYYLRFDVLRP